MLLFFFFFDRGEARKKIEEKKAENFTIHKMEVKVSLLGRVWYSRQSMGFIMG